MWRTSVLIIWRIGDESSVRMCGVGTVLPRKGRGNGDVGRGRQTHRKIWIPDEEPEPPTGHEPAAFQVILVDPTIRLFIEG